MLDMPLSFLVVNFLVGFFSDMGLNFLAGRPSVGPFAVPRAIRALHTDYFAGQVFWPAVTAGLTVTVALLVLMGLSQLLWGFIVPTYAKQLLRFLLLAFLVGFVADIIIRDLHIFGHKLDQYYKLAGAGLWGGLSLVFSVAVTYYFLRPKTSLQQH